MDPQRDVGPTHVHGVIASMVSTAPRFEEVAPALAERLFGAVLVAHNLAFDARMLTTSVIIVEEQAEFSDLVGDLRLSGNAVAPAHRRYLDELVAAALRRHPRPEADTVQVAASARRRRDRHGGSFVDRAGR